MKNGKTLTEVVYESYEKFKFKHKDLIDSEEKEKLLRKTFMAGSTTVTRWIEKKLLSDFFIRFLGE